MAAFFHLLRDRIFSRAYIILQRQPEETDSEDQKSSAEEPTQNENNASISEDSKIDSLGNDSDNAKGSNSAANSISQQKSITRRNTKKNSDLKSPNYRTVVNISDSKTLEVDLMTLYSDLKCSNNLETRCKSALELALCLAHDTPDVEVTDCLGALKDLCDSYNFPDLAVCHALLLCAFTKVSMSVKELELLEERILSLAVSLKRRGRISQEKMYKTSVLVENHNETTLDLCQKLFHDNYVDVWEIDISTICCCSLCNLSSLVRQHDNELGTKYVYKNSTLKYILGMTGKSTQEIVSEYMVSQKQPSPNNSSYRVNRCLHVLEHALSVNPDLSSCESFQHESFSLPHCLTRLLGWSVSSVFPEKDNEYEAPDSNNFTFHLSTLVCILKVLSVLTFNPHQYDSFTNVKGLMEKILICTLKAYFESDCNHFDIQILCLEMLINLYIKNQKTFVLLCLKKFKISESEDVFAVEALLKMLSDNLEKIKEVKESTPYPQNNAESKSSEVKEAPTIEIEESPSNEDANKVSMSDTTEDSPNVNSDIKVEKDDNEDVSMSDTTEDLPNVNSDIKVEKDDIEDASNANIAKESNEENSEKLSNEDSTKKPAKENVVETDPVLLAASKDMEHSTIVSFICVLIVFFMRTKQNFKEFILSKLTSEVLREATDVSKKFLEFASLTGGMPVTGILILTQTINKLQAMQSA